MAPVTEKSASHEDGDIVRLRKIMKQLRTPETGCPWDMEQTFGTIAPYTIEEAYEVADAIERDDMYDLVDELGDLLLQIVFHAQMAEEKNIFSFEDVVNAICRKMIRRHPHVFGDEDARTAGAVKGMWERIKSEEADAKRAQTGNSDLLRVLDDVPPALPALVRAVKLQKKAARTGFDWPTIAPVFEKIREEIDELEDAVKEQTSGNSATDEMKDETGDLLFAIANLARHLGLEPEAALHGTNAKFTRRFNYIEDHIVANGRKFESCDLDELETLWNQAKSMEK